MALRSPALHARRSLSLSLSLARARSRSHFSFSLTHTHPPSLPPSGPRVAWADVLRVRCAASDARCLAPRLKSVAGADESATSGGDCEPQGQGVCARGPAGGRAKAAGATLATVTFTARPRACAAVPAEETRLKIDHFT
jgi:hypothetical protein